ncbi:molybdopterin-containing oxidoreductase family protein [Rubneribacter badeniensis]|uniref:Molybdopterin-dependent oxidoreductase n=1 Tax=Rubneribacter badeniensis TaxID=2070688 RepID=A0A9D2VL46_9ACTN|nr:Perchlorate reductase subunit alpha precursor [Coriobacteriaceae bacterium CHKCI002]HJH43634.1 molybdopterin-dependent oxidoreductase [Rubneribacter badeniensis]
MAEFQVPRKGISRRSFLKTSAAVAGVAAASGTATMSALAADGSDGGAPEEHDVVCVCGCNCQGTCSLVATVREGRMVNIRSNENIPYPAYERICNRGFSHANRLYDFNRVKYPLKRATWSIEEPHVENRGSDEWERLSWDEAAKLVADTLKYNTENYGARSNLFLCSAGNSFGVYGGSFTGNSFANVNGYTTLDVCLDYGDLHGIGQVTGGGWDFNQRNMSGDYRFAKTLFIWDTNPPNSQPHNWHFCIEAKEAGANLVVIDPTYTVAASQATKWVPIKPGTDPALGMAILNVIIANEWYDTDFLREKTCAPLLVREDNGHFLRSTDFGEDGPAQLPEYPFYGMLLLQASKANKVPTLEQTADYVVWDADANARGAINETANPALEGRYEVDGVKVTTAWTLLKEHMAECTPEWAEKITEVPADTIVELARMYAQDAPSTIYAGYHLYDNCEVMGMTWATMAAITGNIGKKGASIGHLGKDKPYLNRTPDLFPNGLTGLANDIPWLALNEILETGQYLGKEFPVRLLYNVGANPVGSYAAQKRIIDEMLPKINCIVTNDLEFSDTVRYSDIVLPCTHYFEYEWIQGASHVPFINHANKVVEPIGEAKEDVDIFREISKHLGNDACTKFYSKTNEEMMRVIVDTEAGAKLGISLDNLRKEGVIADREENWVHWEDQRFPTLSGRLEFYVENPGARINIGKPIDKEFYHLPTYHEPNEAYDGSEQHGKYPLYHYCERTRWHMHTQFNYAPILRELDPEPFLRMNPVDAESRGIADGDYVEAYNDRGHCVCKAKFDMGVRPGMVSSPKGWPRDLYVAGSYQELTNDHLNTMHQNTSFDDTLVEVRKYEGEVK